MNRMSKFVCLLSLVAIGGLTSCGEGIVVSSVADSTSASATSSAASSSVVTDTEVPDKALLLNNIVTKYNTGAQVPSSTKYGISVKENAEVAAVVPPAQLDVSLKAGAEANASLIKGTDGVYSAGANFKTNANLVAKSSHTYYNESSSKVTEEITSTQVTEMKGEAEISDQTYVAVNGTSSISKEGGDSSSETNTMTQYAHADQKVADYFAAGKITDIAGYAIPALNLTADDLKSVQEQITSLVANPAFEIKATQNVATQDYTLNLNIANSFFASLKGVDMIPFITSALTMVGNMVPQAADTTGMITSMLSNFSYIHIGFEDVTKIKVNFTVKLNKDYFPLSVAGDVDLSGTSIVAGMMTAKSDAAGDTSSSETPAAEEMPLATISKLAVKGGVDLTLGDAVSEVKMSADNKTACTSKDATDWTADITKLLSGKGTEVVPQ